MGGLQPWHLVVLAIVVVALFGYNKLPEVTRSVGKSLRIFKTEMKGLSADDEARDRAQYGVVAPAAAATPLVAATTSSAAPSADEIARAQAVLAAAAAAKAAEVEPVQPVVPSPAAPVIGAGSASESTPVIR